MEASHEGIAPIFEAFNEEHLPQWAIQKHWTRHDATDIGLQRIETSRVRQCRSRQVIAQLEVRVIDANRWCGAKWCLDNALPHDRHEMHSLLHEALNHGENFRRGSLLLGRILQNQHGSDVEWCAFGFKGDKCGIEWTELLH